MSPPLFPIDLHDVPASTTFHDLPNEPWTIGSATDHRVRRRAPGTDGRATASRRTDASSRSCPTTSRPRSATSAHESPDWIDGFAIAENADVLMHDAQYTDEEYATRRGWGHSSFADAVAYAQVTGAKKLLMFHHDPTHDDATLEEMQRGAAQLWEASDDRPALAAAGMTIELTEASVSVPA